MLEEYKHLNEIKATEVLGDEWRKANKNTLFYKAIENETTNKLAYEAYISAIIVRYFNLINLYTYKAKNAFYAEDCYEWLLDVIYKALKERPWVKGSGNRLEGDPNGPDKYINKCVWSRVKGFYQFSNAEKRKDSYTKQTSLEGMLETSGDSQMPGDDKLSHIESNHMIQDMVRKEFNSNNYTEAFIIDGIINAGCIDYTYKYKKDEKGNNTKEIESVWSQFNKKKLSSHIRTLNDTYCKEFSSMYNIELNKVNFAKDVCAKMTSARIYTKLNRTLLNIKNSPLLKEEV